jgi:hypothetical protein
MLILTIKMDYNKATLILTKVIIIKTTFLSKILIIITFKELISILIIILKINKTTLMYRIKIRIILEM